MGLYLLYGSLASFLVREQVLILPVPQVLQLEKLNYQQKPHVQSTMKVMTKNTLSSYRELITFFLMPIYSNSYLENSRKTGVLYELLE